MELLHSSLKFNIKNNFNNHNISINHSMIQISMNALSSGCSPRPSHTVVRLPRC